MPSADLCTEEEFSELVHTLYCSVRADDLAGRIADSLWDGYRRSRQVEQLPEAL